MEFSWKGAYYNGLLSDMAYAGEKSGEWADKELLTSAFEAHGFSTTSIDWYFDNFDFIDASLDNTLTGYDGILIRRKELNEDGTIDYFLLNRGTEADLQGGQFDPADFLADAIALHTGESLGQIAQLENLYLNNEGLLSAENANLTVLGHSLGGHLSTLFAVSNPDLVDNVWTYNTLGVPEEVMRWDTLTEAQKATVTEVTEQAVDTLEDVTKYSEFFGKALASVVNALYNSRAGDVDAPEGVNMWNLILEDGPDVANELFARHGESLYLEGGEVQSESDLLDVHSISTLTSTILMMYMMTSVDQTMTEKAVGNLIRSISADRLLSHDKLVEAVADYFFVEFRANDLPGAGDSKDDNYDPTYRASFEQAALDVIAIAEEQGGTNLHNFLELAPELILNRVQREGATGAAYRYAVLNELPFVIPGAAGFAERLAGDPSYWENHLSVEEWNLRIKTLQATFEMRIAGDDLAPAELGLNAWNLATGTQLESAELAGRNGANQEDAIDVVFGTQEDESLRPFADSDHAVHFFAGGGEDELIGSARNDHLDGGADNDHLYGIHGHDTLVGGLGDDTLAGGLGNDRLYGGEGADTYLFASGEGRDVVNDPSASARIVIDGVTLGTIHQLESDKPIYEDGTHRYQRIGSDLVILVNGVTQPDLDQTITLIDWDAALNHYGLSVVAAEDAGTPEPTGNEMHVQDGDADYQSADGTQSASRLHTHQVEREDWINGVSLHYEADQYAAYDPESFPFDSQPFVFEGGHVDDYLFAGAHRDHLYGGDGDDLLSFYNGANIGEGGRGSDYLQGGADADMLWGDSSGYHIRGSVAQIEESAGDQDYIDGGAGDDWISGGSWRDTLLGGFGNDMLDGGAGDDWIIAGEGDDQVLGDSRVELRDGEQVLYRFHRYVTQADDSSIYNDWIQAGAGNDLVLGELGDDRIFGGDGADVLMGDRLNDAGFYAQDADNPEDDYQLLAASLHGNDEIEGGAGDDQIYGNAGNDQLLGGLGNDFIHGDDHTLSVAEGGDDLLFGGEGSDQLIGAGGADRLYGGAGDDTALGGAGNDEVRGGDGNDILLGDDSNLAVSQHGDDLLYGDAGADQMQGGAGNDRLYGGTGSDTLFGEAGDDDLHGGDDADDLVGGAGMDYLDGGNGDDRLWGGEGADVLRGGAGHDYLQGEGGNDVYLYAQGDGLVEIYDVNGLHRIELRGTVTESDLQFSQTQSHTDIQVGDAADVIRMDNNTWSRISGIYLPDGSKVLPVLEASTGTNALFGNAGADLLSLGAAVVGKGNAGEDLMLGGGVAQHLFGGAGDDLIFGYGGDDHLYGDAGDDVLLGGDGNDTLSGGSGADRLLAGAGFDVLSGGAGDDIYVYEPGDDFNEISVSDRDGFDAIEFAAGIAPEDVQVRMRLDGSLRISLREGYNGLSIDTADYAEVVEEIRFEDAPETVWAAADFMGMFYQMSELADTAWVVEGLAPELYGLAGNDELIGGERADLLDGGADADRLYGRGGADHLLGAAGDDRIWGGAGDDVINGGAGNDSLRGEAGFDTFVFENGFGHDEVFMRDSESGADRFLFQGGLTSDKAQVTMDRAGHLTLTFAGSEDSLWLPQFQFAYEYQYGDEFVFADGVKWGLEDLFALHQLGSAGDDYIWGSDAADILFGQAGDDTLRGYAGDDELTGGAGNDYLDGGEGLNRYYFQRGDGQDTIRVSFNPPEGQIDQLIFGSGILPEDVQPRDILNATLRLHVLGTEDTVDVPYFFNVAGATLLEIRFADAPNVVWDRAAVDAMKHDPTPYDDEIYGGEGSHHLRGEGGNDTLWGLGGPDILEGGDGDDWLYGRSGDDTLFGDAGDDTLIGGHGDDLQSGGAGSDVYEYGKGSGNDLIQNFDDGAGRFDVLRFGASVKEADVRVYRHFDDLRIDVFDDTITVQDWFVSALHQLNAIAFADGAQWNADHINYLVTLPTELSDHLVGSDAADTLEGAGGDDLLQGGKGDDVLVGGAGADTYYYLAGDGHDVIDALDDSALDSEQVRLGDAIAPEQVNARRSGDDLLLYLSLEGSLRILGHFADASRAISYVQFGDGSKWTASELAQRVLVPTSGNDELTGYASGESISGLAGNDVLDGRGGSDELIGGTGSDTYRFGIGYGSDRVDNFDRSEGRFDQIAMNAEVQAENVTVQREANDLVLLLSETGDQIRVSDHFALKGKTAYNFIDAVGFVDGTVWDRQDLVGFTELSALGSYVLHGDAQANLLQGLGGDDQLFAAGGDDTLRGGGGNDQLEGGRGDDFLSGGRGSDVYLFRQGDGADTIDNFDVSADRHDVVRFAEGISAAQTSVLKLGDDLLLATAPGDSILVRNFYQSGYAIDAVQFADGTAWSQADLENRASENRLPSVQGESYVMNEDGLLTLRVEELLANDTDADGDLLSVLSVDGAENGEAVFDAAAGEVRFRPDTDYFGMAAFRYQVSDGKQVAHGQVSVQVLDQPEPENAAPAVTDDSLSVIQGERVVVSAGELLANDFDADGDALELVAVRNVQYAQVQFDPVKAEITFTPEPYYLGTASFDYQVSDGVDTAMGTVHVNVLPDPSAQHGTEADDIVDGGRKADVLYGLDGHDQLDGGNGNDELHGGAGNDLLRGGEGNDVYVVQAGNGHDVIDNTSRKNGYDVLWLTGQTNEKQVWLSRSGTDLEVTLLGDAGSVKVQDWYAGRNGELQEIHAGGKTLMNEQVETLVDAMSAYTMPTGAGAQVQDELLSTVNSVWQ